MTDQPTFKIADTVFGISDDVFIIAEAGVNHNGNMDNAIALVDAAAASGADAIKFQTFTPELLVAPDAEKGNYQVKTTGSDEGQFAMLAALQLSGKQFAVLAERCRQKNILFLTTPFDVEAMKSFDDLGVSVVKLSSGDITNYQLLDAAAKSTLPVILSTGMSTLEETTAAVHFLRSRNCKSLAILHCNSAYPTPAEDANLRILITLKNTFPCVIGFSDHTLGHHLSCAAVAMGARILEKHFTLDKAMPGPDHVASLDVEELDKFVACVRDTSRALGNGNKYPTPSELENIKIGRRGIYWKSGLDAGHAITEEDLICLRPAGRGIEASEFFNLIGSKIVRTVKNGTPVQKQDFSS
ncbi:MAG: N-acetylneuraminate synthase family protein [Chthoniobacterales bacterium]